MTELRPGQGSDQFNVRFPPGMRDRIKVAADLNGRSMNAEIIATLEERYPAASVDVRAVEGLLHYIASAITPAQALDRVAEVNAKFEAVGSPLRISQDPEGKLSIVTEF
ncbi:MAG: helix-turn-helix domain-containing protein [Rhodobacteraceae bacterium]|nr:MAG: helix-turn-helix domain-containing protein [Paracoccaceae bacterium]